MVLLKFRDWFQNRGPPAFCGYTDEIELVKWQNAQNFGLPGNSFNFIYLFLYFFLLCDFSKAPLHGRPLDSGLQLENHCSRCSFQWFYGSFLGSANNYWKRLCTWPFRSTSHSIHSLQFVFMLKLWLVLFDFSVVSWIMHVVLISIDLQGPLILSIRFDSSWMIFMWFWFILKSSIIVLNEFLNW